MHDAWNQDITFKARKQRTLIVSRNQETQSTPVQNQKEQAETNYPHLFFFGEDRRVPREPGNQARPDRPRARPAGQEHREGGASNQHVRDQVRAIKSIPQATAKPARQRMNRRRGNPAR